MSLKNSLVAVTLRDIHASTYRLHIRRKKKKTRDRLIFWFRIEHFLIIDIALVLLQTKSILKSCLILSLSEPLWELIQYYIHNTI